MPEWIGDHLQRQLLRDSSEGLARQLTRLLREAIVAGRLPGNSRSLPGHTRLPPSRELARQLQVGRNTVIEAYAQLQAEGYLLSRQGAGSFVAPLFSPPASLPPLATRSLPQGLSQRGRALFESSGVPTGLTGAFAPGMPEVRQFPHTQWQNLLSRHQRSTPWPRLGYTADGGLPALRAVLADYLTLSRGVRCTPEQIIVTAGAQHALELCARLLADDGDSAWVEEPGYAGAHAALRAAGLKLQPAAVDAEGLNPQAVASTVPPRLIYTTPSHQYPLGVVMSLPRRLALLAAARQHGAWIIEDDYDSEFRYSSAPLPALQGLAEDERVIYVGTLSKVMYPGLRLGYLVVPMALVEAFRATHVRLYREPPYNVQAALADFIGGGHFMRHIRRMRELYQTRQDHLRRELAGSAANLLPLSPGEAGLHLVAGLPASLDEHNISHAAAQQGIVLRPLARHYLATPTLHGLVLGYAGVEENEISRGVAVLANLCRHASCT